MSLAVLASRALCGLEAFTVRVEVHVGHGLPAFHMVGLPDAGVRESRERVRSAIISSGFERSEEHTSELQSLMRISYAVFCLKNNSTTQSTIPHPKCTPIDQREHNRQYRKI